MESDQVAIQVLTIPVSCLFCHHESRFVIVALESQA